jgi:Ca2+-transporting ATPase
LAATVGFTSITLVQLLHAVSARSETHSVFDREPFPQNPYLPVALASSALAQIGISILPATRRLLTLAPMGALDWLTATAGAIGPFIVNELIKSALRASPKLTAAPVVVLPQAE